MAFGLKFRRKRKSAIGLRVCRRQTNGRIVGAVLWQRLGHASYRDWVLCINYMLSTILYIAND